jgi:hypothetical protein
MKSSKYQQGVLHEVLESKESLPSNIGPELPDNEGSSTSSRINWEDLCNQGTSLE